MQEFIISLMGRFGYPGIFFLITVENLFPPIPSEVILTMGGFLTTCTSMNVTGVILFSTLGSLLGAIILYYIGKLLNKERLLLPEKPADCFISMLQTSRMLQTGLKKKAVRLFFSAGWFPFSAA